EENDVVRAAEPTERNQTEHGVQRKLRDAGKAAGITPEKVTTDRPEEIAKHLAEALRAVPHRRVLSLYDNADQFLDADARDRFRVAEGLRKLMADTHQRFKAVFAGGPSV